MRAPAPVLAAVVVTLATAAAGQQSEAARAAIETVRPARGSTAPRNMKVWIETTSFSASDFALLDAGGQPIATQATVVAVPNSGATLVILTPNQELAPGSYSVSRAAIEMTAFTVTSEVDTTPPEPLNVSAKSESFAPVPFQPRFSGGTSTTLTFDVVPEFAMVVRKDQEWIPRAALAMASPDNKVVFLPNLPEGKQQLDVFHFDLAGNATRSTVTVDVPPVTGCSVSGAWPLALLGLALLRGRRSAR